MKNVGNNNNRESIKIISIIMRNTTVVIISVMMLLTLIPMVPSSIIGVETESYAASNSKGQEVARLALRYQGKTYSQVRTALKNDGYKVWGSTGDWCAWYVSNIARAAGVSESVIPNYVYADGGSKPGFYIWAKGKGLYRSKGSYTPKPGDLALCGSVSGNSYNIYHIEIVTEVKGSTVKLCGGNTGNDNYSKSVVSKARTRSDVCGYIEIKYPNNEVRGVQTVLNGRYHIVSALNNDYCVDVYGGRADNGTNIQLYTSRMDATQSYNVTYLGNGFYKITHWKTGKSLDVDNSGKVNGTNVLQWQYNGSYNQQWVIRKNSDGSYSIVSRCNGLCLDVAGGKVAKGTNIQMYSDNGTTSQKFYFVEWAGETISSGRYHIVSNLHNDYCLDVYGASKEKGANVQLYTARMDPNQTWNVRSMGNGFYKITHYNSQLSLDVYNQGKADGTNVQQWTDTGNNAQRWIIKRNSDGSFGIISKCNGLYLDVSGGKAANGNNIQMYTRNDSSFQKFYFVEWAGETISSGRYHIVSKLDDSKCLDVYGASKEKGANVQLYSATKDPLQTWNVRSMRNGFYKITSYNSGLSLDVYNQGKNDGSNVQQWTDTGNNAQRWIIRPNGDGTYNIISKCNGLSVEAAGGKSSNSTNIQMYLKNGTDAQKWVFVEYSEDELIDNPDSTTDDNEAIELRGGDSQDKYEEQSPCEEQGETNIHNNDEKQGDPDVRREHTWEDEPTVDAAPTCTGEGSQSIHCSTCDKVKDVEIIPATGHRYGNWLIVESPSCTKTGLKKRTCVECGSSDETYIPVSNHRWNSKPSVDVQATCTSSGKQSVRCLDCSDVKEKSTIEALDHNWSEIQYIWSADNNTVTATRVCKRDSAHKETETVKTVSAVTKKATYTTKGQTTYTAIFNNRVFAKQSKTLSDINQLQKKANNITVKVKNPTIKYTKVKSKAQSIPAKNSFIVSGAQGKVTYKKISGNAQITINSAGRIVVKKAMRKGSYKIKVKIVASGTDAYKPGTKTVMLTIKIK